MNPVRALLLADGTARWKELSEAGVSRGSLMRALAAGDVVREHRGCYALPHVDRAEVDATIFRGVPCCVSVLAALGLPVVPDATRTHVWVPMSRSLARRGIRPMARVVVHRTDRVDPERLGRVEIALDMAGACLSPYGQMAAIDAAVHTGVVDLEAIDAFELTPPDRRRWLRARVDGRAESPGESFARAAMLDAGLQVASQVEFGGIGRVDFLVEGRAVVECDGRSYHSDPAKFTSDRDRDVKLELRGYLPMRFPFQRIVDDPHGLASDVRAVLWRHGR
ncbi:type IV toxin-antitoxin system AbiEi family antitoxin domain-containing protein [Demequina pelophila]|uniref:type IV toxin-antitoxin system AbiEi family antitoxin domain-containing protein n=1 Tax=Demequina pelophila TaxID=1638984 RepID=UPI0007804C9A|nr:type IV toxin-antitoxin system AbiEi family antitoxin domain-containing protein [Demequina pelophila]